MISSQNLYSGGCQCGSIRYEADSLGRAAICHCRMCQKQFGGFYGPFVHAVGVKWTRSLPKYFKSSNFGRRGFCGNCGTPLTFEMGDAVELAIGTLDNPTLAAPIIQINTNDKITFVDSIPTLPTRSSSEKLPLDARVVGFINYQHPDHDTTTWPPDDIHE